MSGGNAGTQNAQFAMKPRAAQWELIYDFWFPI
jgi:hypothetical protein